jgi:hypothetical protein
MQRELRGAPGEVVSSEREPDAPDAGARQPAKQPHLGGLALRMGDGAQAAPAIAPAGAQCAGTARASQATGKDIEVIRGATAIAGQYRLCGERRPTNARRTGPRIMPGHVFRAPRRRLGTMTRGEGLAGTDFARLPSPPSRCIFCGANAGVLRRVVASIDARMRAGEKHPLNLIWIMPAQGSVRV